MATRRHRAVGRRTGAAIDGATRDLYRLNPDEAPGPQAMFARFVGWTPFRRTIVSPPPG
ncbi:hypothetical protein [Micromonospora parathelypteridis]|uniref:Uncharacterized protein n=1 Tax=Micromonospora parathelypteridis TaxID=1839617 RepID=A0A840VZ56_9ACTN|nr:hypothetical protein [Micromonospora parathelypteridis]MBB5481256.1 hypothetical protein [Micromonospora parathelypteridis]GGO19365.1 hypothetical protein GCM10011576_35400 [Micromonospora parathelypteridis]